MNATFFFQVLSKKKLQDLVREIDPNEQLDEDVEEVCQKFSADFKGYFGFLMWYSVVLLAQRVSPPLNKCHIPINFQETEEILWLPTYLLLRQSPCFKKFL